MGDLCLNPGLRRSPGKGRGYPLQYSCLENSMDLSSMGSQRVRHNWTTFNHTSSSTSSQTLGTLILTWGHSNRYAVLSHCSFNCIYLMINDSYQLVMCLSSTTCHLWWNVLCKYFVTVNIFIILTDFFKSR